MEKLKLQLPLGYRFVPTDLELIVEYLIKKLKNKHFSCNAVVEHDDIYTTEPWNLKGNKDDIGGPIDKRYYFVNREKKSAASDGTNPTRTVKPGNGSRGGFWKATGGDKQILDKRNMSVGVKKSLKYLSFINDEKMTKDNEKTGWIMHEYTLPSRHNGFQPWVLCSIRFNGTDSDYKEQYQKYLKQKKNHQHLELQQEAPHQQEDMIMQDYAKGGLPQACEASSTSMSGACSSSANNHQDVPPVLAQDQLTNDNNNNNNAAHDYGGLQEWEELDFLWTAADEYSYRCHPGTAAFKGTDQQCAVPPAGGFGLNNKFN